MKKATLLITALSLVLGLSQCRKPNAPTINGIGGTQHVVLQASLDNGGSKIAQEGNGIKWAEYDQIVVKQGETLLGTLTCTDAENGIFTGDIATTSGNITFTFGERNFESQTGTLDGAISLSSGDVAYNPEGSYDVTMTMPHAVLKLNLRAFAPINGSTTVTISANSTPVASVTGITIDAAVKYVAMPAAESTEYTFSGINGSAKKTWTLTSNTYYTSTDNPGEAIVIAIPYLYFGNLNVDVLASATFATILYSSPQQQCEYGFVYSTSQNPTVDNGTCTGGGSGLADEYGLSFYGGAENPGTYYVRAYAKGEDGVYIYSAQQEFTIIDF